MLTSEQLRISLDGLRSHKLRSLLTMLGIIFGVAAVIAMLAIGEGARRKTLSQIQALGLQNIIISDTANPDEERENPSLRLNAGDVQAIQQILPTVSRVVPVFEQTMLANYKSRFIDLTVTATEPSYFELLQMTIQSGGFFSGIDNRLFQRVCVLGEEAAQALFVSENPIGQIIKIETLYFTVIGVLQRQPVSVAGSSELNLNNRIFVPLRTLQARSSLKTGTSEISQIIVAIREPGQVVSSADFIDQIIYRRHNQVRNYKLVVPEQLLRQSEETQKIFNIVMGAIAGISLLVGGIGIMNIMLASVLERTREIGVRRALGATRADIRNQFLTEAVILSLLGGLTGILIGYAMTLLVTLYSEWETAISVWSVVLAFGVSSAVGILFGYYPARNAALLDPIEALRYE